MFPWVSLSPLPLPRARVGFTGPRGSPSRCSGPNRPQNSWRIQGGSGRQHQVFMEIQLSKVGGGWGARGWRGGAAVPGAGWVGAAAGRPIRDDQPGLLGNCLGSGLYRCFEDAELTSLVMERLENESWTRVYA